MNGAIAVPVLAGALLAVAAAPAAAQDAAATDTITGRVLAADSTPIAGARVSMEGAAGREWRAQADSLGRYRLPVPGGAPFYRVTARAFGYIPLTAIVLRPADGGPMVRDLRLNPRVIELEEIEVTAREVRVDESRDTPGEESGEMTSLLAEMLPLEHGDLAGVGVTLPGVIHSGENALSIAGQPPSQNRTTVDGASYGGGRLPSEAVSSTGIIANTYDVSRGRFSGGQIAATTISGTNIWGGALSVHLDDPALRYGMFPGDAFGQRDRNVRVSGGGGGALVRDKLFIYGAADLARTTGPRPFLDPDDPAALRRLGLAPDSVQRFLDIANDLGLHPGDGAALPEARSEFASVLARVDYALSDRHSLMTRLDWRGSRSSGLGASPFSLSGSDVEQRTTDAGVLADLTSGWGLWANALRLYHAAGDASATPSTALPTGQVRVAAGLPAIGFGGRTSLLPERRSSLWEISDALVRETEDGKHRIKAGILLQEERASVMEARNRYGTFTFNSLRDLAAGRAASFTRDLSQQPAEARRRYAALYLGETWSPADHFALIYGLRLEGSRYGERPALDPAVDALPLAHGRGVPSDVFLSPRVGFRYFHPRGQTNVAGGVGAFRGTVSLPSLASVWNQVGSRAFDMRLTCIGPAAPGVDWNAYAAGPGAIPSTCAGGTSLFADRAPSVTLFNGDFAAPRLWRTSLNVNGRLTGRLIYHLRGLLAHGTHLPTALDRNLAAAPAFTLPAEDGRSVYVEPGAIDPRTGGVASEASRRVPSLGTIREIGAAGESWTGQLTAGLGGVVGGGPFFTGGLYYTLTRARDLAGGVPAPGAPAATTAGDPAQREWAPSDFERRHAFQAFVTADLSRWFPWQVQVGAIAGLASGLPFTPMVARDVNGDGFSNDRAFIFDPRAVDDPAMAAGIERLLEEGPESVRDCLREQFGRIARRNSCRTGWTSWLDLHVGFSPWKDNWGSRRLRFSITASNVSAGLDYLLHGPDDLHGWGQYAFPDATLLEVDGFDPDRRAFDYAVNPRFGRPLGGGALRSPFRIILEGRITIGEDPRYQPMARSVERGVPGVREQIRRQVAERIRNAPGVILQLNRYDPGALALTPEQTARLQAAAATFAPRIAAAVDALIDAFTEPGPQTAARRAHTQERALDARAVAEDALQAVREILTPEQWDELPIWLTRPATLDTLLRPPTFEITVPAGGR